MGIKVHKESDHRYTVVWETNIKESTQKNPTSLSIPYSVKGKQTKIDLPLGSSVVADIEVQPTTQKIKLNNYSVHFNNTGFEDGFADNITHRVVMYNAVQRLWLEDKLLPQIDLHIEELLKEIPRTDRGTLQLKTDLAKAVVFVTYLFTVSNIPTGFQSEYLEKKTGMSNNYITQIINRYSVTYDDVKKAKKTNELFSSPMQLAINDKTVYFVRHTDRKLKGGYIPMWVAKLVEKELSKNFKAIGYQYKLPPEYITGVSL